MFMEIKAEKDKILRISGPASISVEKGAIRVLGANYNAGSRVVINRFRSYAVKILEDETVVKVSLGDGGSVEEPSPGEEVIDYWENASTKIIEYCREHEHCIITIVGPVESGKSSYTCMLSNLLLSNNIPVTVIDADIGQADIGLPGFISMSTPSKPLLWLRDLQAEELYFVGSITPSIYTHRVISGIEKLLLKALKRSRAVVIDTDGWIHGGQAVEYKIDLIRTIKPDHIVVLGEGLNHILKRTFKNTSINVIELPSPKIVRKRNREDRRYLRSKAYRRYLEKAKIRKLKIDETPIIGSYLFSGESIDLTKISNAISPLGIKPLYASLLHETVFIVIDRPTNIKNIVDIMNTLFPNKEIYVFTKGFERGLLVSILDSELEDRAPGIILSIDFDKKEITIQTPYEGEIRAIHVGKIKLSETWEEVGKPSKYMI